MKILKIVIRLAFTLSIAAAIITHSTVIAIGSLVIASINLGILIGERSSNERR